MIGVELTLVNALYVLAAAVVVEVVLLTVVATLLVIGIVRR
jgi:hypothetical protein